MGCACRGGKQKSIFVWAGEKDGKPATQTYPTEIQAKARVIRDGGSYVRKPKA